MKSTLKRESKALEIVEIDTFEVSDLSFALSLVFSCFSWSSLLQSEKSSNRLEINKLETAG